MSDAPLAVLRADLNPVAWKAPTAFPIRRGGKVTAGMAPATEVVAYQAALREEFLRQWTERPTIKQECRLEWRFARQLTSYISDVSGRKVTRHRVDLSNCVKSAEDALQPYVLANDVLVQSFSAQWAEPQSTTVTDPFVEVAIYLL